jgi:hypothetical protein
MTGLFLRILDQWFFSGGLFRGIWIGGFLGLVALSGDIGVDRDVKMLISTSFTFHFRRVAVFLRRMVHYPRLKESAGKGIYQDRFPVLTSALLRCPSSHQGTVINR